MTPARQQIAFLPSRTGAVPVRSAEQLTAGTRPAATPVSHVRGSGFGEAPYLHQYGGVGGGVESHLEALYASVAAEDGDAETHSKSLSLQSRSPQRRRRNNKRGRRRQPQQQHVMFAEVSPGRSDYLSRAEMIADEEAAYMVRRIDATAASSSTMPPHDALREGRIRQAHSHALLRSLEVELLGAGEVVTPPRGKNGGGRGVDGLKGMGSGSPSKSSVPHLDLHHISSFRRDSSEALNRRDSSEALHRRDLYVALTEQQMGYLPPETPPTVAAVLPANRRLVSQERRNRGEQYGDALLKGRPRVPLPKPGPLPRSSLPRDNPLHEAEEEEEDSDGHGHASELPGGYDARGGGGGSSMPVLVRPHQVAGGLTSSGGGLCGSCSLGALAGEQVERVYGTRYGTTPAAPPATGPASKSGKRTAWLDTGSSTEGSREGRSSTITAIGSTSCGGGSSGGGSRSVNGGASGIAFREVVGWGGSTSRGSVRSSLSTPSLTLTTGAASHLQHEPLQFSGARSCYSFHPLTQSSLSPPVSPYDLTVRHANLAIA